MSVGGGFASLDNCGSVLPPGRLRLQAAGRSAGSGARGRHSARGDRDERRRVGAGAVAGRTGRSQRRLPHPPGRQQQPPRDPRLQRRGPPRCRRVPGAAAGRRRPGGRPRLARRGGRPAGGAPQDGAAGRPPRPPGLRAGWRGGPHGRQAEDGGGHEVRARAHAHPDARPNHKDPLHVCVQGQRGAFDCAPLCASGARRPPPRALLPGRGRHRLRF
mmetsp:Transcript_26723/g.67319  ORF Transcript_26723/g.67319 Transcript_26723/m.67319 type:complete len:216 (+) Transcript_26723:210-857(+)